MPSGAPGDLGDLGAGQVTQAPAVELAKCGEGDVIDIHVESHADGVGGDQVIDLAGLIEPDLGVARARAERAQHHRRPAALAAQGIGEGIDIAGREGHDHASRR